MYSNFTGESIYHIWIVFISSVRATSELAFIMKFSSDILSIVEIKGKPHLYFPFPSLESFFISIYGF